MSSIKILYGGRDAFYPQPVPFVGLDTDTLYYGERWAQRENLTLNGQLTGCTFEAINQAYQNLLGSFSKSYQNLEMWQTEGSQSGRFFLKETVEINSIEIQDNNWIDVMPYTVSLSCYPSGYFSGVYGVLEPSDDWSFEEQSNATLAATHTISCRGLNTSAGVNNSLDNARLWAAGRTGIARFVAPIFISGVSQENFCLTQQTESIDRFNGTYSVTETYINDLARTGYGVIRYSTDIQSGDNLISLSLNGTAEGCGQNITGLRYAFNRLDKVAIALKEYQSVFNRTDLNPSPLTQSYDENPNDTTIGFSYTFNSDNSPNISFDYTVSLSTATNGVITASIQGVVRARTGSLQDRLNQCVAYANTVSLYNLTLPFYNGFDQSSSAPLNPVPISSGLGKNQSDGTVSLNATFTNQAKVSNILDMFNATISFQPSVYQVDAQPRLDGNGSYSVVNLRYANRAAISINGDATVSPLSTSAQGEAAIKEACYNLFVQYGRRSEATLDVSRITSLRNDGKVMSFSFTWSFNSPAKLGPSSLALLTV